MTVLHTMEARFIGGETSARRSLGNERKVQARALLSRHDGMATILAIEHPGQRRERDTVAFNFSVKFVCTSSHAQILAAHVMPEGGSLSARGFDRPRPDGTGE